jgi:hypothetical protein
VAAGHGLVVGVAVTSGPSLPTAGAPSVCAVPLDDDALADDDDALADDDPPVALGLALALDEDEDAAAAVWAGAAVVPGLPQVLEVVGPVVALEVVGALELGLGVEVVGLGVGVVAVALALEVALPVSVAVTVPVPVAVSVAVAVLLVLPVLAGAVVLLLAEAVPELAAPPVLDELAADDEHVAPTAGWLVPPGTSPADAPLTAPAPALLVLVEPDVGGGEMNPIDVPICVRIDGTAARTMPTANTAKPTAKAGRRMASRQSRGRCSCRGRSGPARWAPGAVCPWRSPCQPRTRAAFQRHARSASTLTAAARPRVSRNLPARA